MQKHNYLFHWLLSAVLISIAFVAGLDSGIKNAPIDTCLVFREDLGALSNERLDTRIQTLKDTLEYTITVRMTRSMDERDVLEAERAWLEQRLDQVQQ